MVGSGIRNADVPTSTAMVKATHWQSERRLSATAAKHGRKAFPPAFSGQSSGCVSTAL